MENEKINEQDMDQRIAYAINELKDRPGMSDEITVSRADLIATVLMMCCDQLAPLAETVGEDQISHICAMISRMAEIALFGEVKHDEQQ